MQDIPRGRAAIKPRRAPHFHVMNAENPVDIDPLVVELRRFVLTYAEHDSDCPGIDANAWTDQKKVCVCGLALRLDELLAKLDQRLA